MQQHIEKIHKVHLRGDGAIPNQSTTVNHSFLKNSKNRFEHGSSLDKTLDIGERLVRHLNEYRNSEPVLNRINNLERQVAYYENEISRIRSNNWIVPYHQIHGISGHFCGQCKSASFDYVRDVGNDMTMQARHVCNPELVSLASSASNRPPEGSSDKLVAGLVFNALKRVMPGKKFLIGQDLSSEFKVLKDKLGIEGANFYMGIPSRYYLCPVKTNHNLDWLTRVCAKLDTKVAIDESEVMSFLFMTKATYAIFEITSDQMIRRILLKIIN